MNVYTDVCHRCGSPQEAPYTIVSRHLTSEGVLLYTRCACGALRPRLLRHETFASVRGR